MELSQIKYFLAVAKHLNFTRAAESIPITLPTLSQQLRKLEEELGVRLFERSTKKVSLTPAGETFLPTAEAIISNLQTALLSMANHTQSKTVNITVGLIPSIHPIVSSETLPRFYASEKWDNLVLQFKMDGSLPLWRDATMGQVSAAVLVPPLKYLKHGLDATDLGGSKYHVRVISFDEITLVMPQDHALAACEAVPYHRLQNEQMILTDPRHNTYQDYFLEAYCKAGFQPNVRMWNQFPFTHLEDVRKGLGLTLISRQALKTVSLEGLTSRSFDPPLKRPLALVYPAPTPHQEFLEDFYRALKASRL